MATRPTRAMSAMCAMPVTTVQKMIGAISMRISLMKASPSGPIWAAVSGAHLPSAMPSAIAISTQTHNWVHHGLLRGVSLDAAVVAVTWSSIDISGAAEMIVRRNDYNVRRRQASRTREGRRMPRRRSALHQTGRPLLPHTV